MTKTKILTLAGLFAFVGMMLPDVALAVLTSTGSVGEKAMIDIGQQITGNIGTLIGLGIALLGLYTWLVQQSSWGIMMIIGGVAVTAFPGLFTNMQKGFSAAFKSTGASTDKGTDVFISR